MLNMFRADLYRILRGKAIYIVLILITVLALTSTIGLSAGHIGLSTSSNTDVTDTEFMEKLSNAKTLKEVREVMKSEGEFPLDKDIIGQNVNLYYAFIVIVVIILGTDFSSSAIKNTLSSAISRKKYYFSKLALILLICTFLVLFNNYLNYFLNLLINGEKFASSFMDITKLTIIQMPLIYGIISLLVAFIYIFRKTATFNAISIPFIMVVQLIVIGITNLFKIKVDWFYNYEIQFALSNLAINPTNSYILKCILLGVLYIIIFNIVGYYSFKKAEIK